jgi:transposase
MKTQAMTMQELADRYRVSKKTIQRWLKRMGINRSKRSRRIFGPEQVEKIVCWLGEFEDDKDENGQEKSNKAP